MATAAALQTESQTRIEPACENSSHDTELNRTKGFLGGTLAEITAAVPAEHLPMLSDIQAMTDGALVVASEHAMQDIGDNLLVLDELRQRFRRGVRFKGYLSWSDFVGRNSRYSLRTIQMKLTAVNGKDESKVNHVTGNMYTRTERRDRLDIWEDTHPLKYNSYAEHVNWWKSFLKDYLKDSPMPKIVRNGAESGAFTDARGSIESGGLGIRTIDGLWYLPSQVPINPEVRKPVQSVTAGAPPYGWEDRALSRTPHWQVKNGLGVLLSSG